MSKITYKIDKFTDFSGYTREFIFCAVSIENIDSKDDMKVLRIGVSVQNPKDAEIDTELGKRISYGKAMKNKSCCGIIVSNNKGMINTKVVNALLEQEAEYFKINPGKYLKGYNKDRELYNSNSDLYYDKMGL